MKQAMAKHQSNRTTLIIFVLLPILIIFVAIAYPTLVMIPEWQEPLNVSSAHDGRQVALIYIPGFDTPAEAYVPLVSKIQRELEAYNVSLQCSILRFPKLLGKEFPPFWGRETLVERALQQVATPDAHVFLGGHSLGSILAQMVAFRNPTKYEGLLIHGGYVIQKYRSSRLTVPSLTLSGTRDGCNRFTHIAMQHNDLQQLYPSLREYHQHAPALLIEGMNHMQPAGNYHKNPYFVKQDLEATVPMKTALQSVADLTATFILQQLNVTMDTSTFELELERSEERYFRPYMQVVKQDERGETCVLAQQLHLETEGMEVVAHRPSNRAAFVFAKPKGHQSQVQVETFAGRAFNWFGRSSVSSGIQTLQCKMITKEQLFGKTSREFDSCKSINAHVFDNVLASLDAYIQGTYSRAEMGLEFGDDIETATGASWLSHELQVFARNASLMRIYSPRLKTAAGNGRYSGKLYCTLLSMSRAYEYILIDAFRKPSREKDLNK